MVDLQTTLPYDRWIDEAMRGVVRRALQHVASAGLPGAHHLYISFATQAPGVKLADELKERYPDEMTIVLQHQFWDLAVVDDRFEVTLKFRSRLQRLVIPFAAISGFVDPSVNFALQFRPAADASQQPGTGRTGDAPALPQAEDVLASSGAAVSGDAGEVIALDRFRKK